MFEQYSNVLINHNFTKIFVLQLTRLDVFNEKICSK